ncbi:hypothetical protein [Burkholderia cepacia]|uniref:hypothetical protein n=1 Tax=Burkholderia cepacia TaxID=292 RepID=UPI0015899EC3|nr:hypothetical protein [Burkholderia cepacia]
MATLTQEEIAFYEEIAKLPEYEYGFVSDTTPPVLAPEDKEAIYNELKQERLFSYLNEKVVDNSQEFLDRYKDFVMPDNQEVSPLSLQAMEETLKNIKDRDMVVDYYNDYKSKGYRFNEIEQFQSDKQAERILTADDSNYHIVTIQNKTEEDLLNYRLKESDGTLTESDKQFMQQSWAHFLHKNYGFNYESSFVFTPEQPTIEQVIEQPIVEQVQEPVIETINETIVEPIAIETTIPSNIEIPKLEEPISESVQEPILETKTEETPIIEINNEVKPQITLPSNMNAFSLEGMEEILKNNHGLVVDYYNQYKDTMDFEDIKVMQSEKAFNEIQNLSPAEQDKAFRVHEMEENLLNYRHKVDHGYLKLKDHMDMQQQWSTYLQDELTQQQAQEQAIEPSTEQKVDIPRLDTTEPVVVSMEPSIPSIAPQPAMVVEQEPQQVKEPSIINQVQKDFLYIYSELQTARKDIKEETDPYMKQVMLEKAVDIKEELQQFQMKPEEANQFVSMDKDQLKNTAEQSLNIKVDDQFGDGSKIYVHLSKDLQKETVSEKVALKHENLIKNQADFDNKTPLVSMDELQERLKNYSAKNEPKIEQSQVNEVKEVAPKKEPAWLTAKSYKDIPAYAKYFEKDYKEKSQQMWKEREEAKIQKEAALKEYQELKHPTEQQMHNSIEGHKFNTPNHRELRDFFNTTVNYETANQYVDPYMTTGEHRKLNSHLHTEKFFDADTTNALRQMNATHKQQKQDENYWIDDNFKKIVDANQQFEKDYFVYQFNNEHDKIYPMDSLLESYKQRNEVVYGDRIKEIQEKYPEATQAMDQSYAPKQAQVQEIKHVEQAPQQSNDIPRLDNQEQVQMSNQLQAPENVNQKFDPNNFSGEVVDHGSARYKFNDKNDMSYFVTLKNNGVESTRWGVDFARAFEEQDIQIGDHVDLKKVKVENGKQGVTDEQGNQVTTHKNIWEATVKNKQEVQQSISDMREVKQESNSQNQTAPKLSAREKLNQSVNNQDAQQPQPKISPEMKQKFASNVSMLRDKFEGQTMNYSM